MRNLISSVEELDFATAVYKLAEESVSTSRSGYFRMLKDGKDYCFFVIPNVTFAYRLALKVFAVWSVSADKTHRYKMIEPKDVAAKIVANRRKGYRLLDSGFVSTSEAILQLMELTGGSSIFDTQNELSSLCSNWLRSNKDLKRTYDLLFSNTVSVSDNEKAAISML